MNGQGYRRAGFARGLGWLPAGGELLARGLRPLAGVAAVWLLVSMLALIPVAGQLVVALLTPLLTAGALLAFHAVATGSRPPPSTLLAAWQPASRRTALIWIGAFGLIGSVAAFAVLAGWLGTQVTPDQLEAAMRSPEALAELLGEVSLGGGLVLAAAVLAAVITIMYFAIPLVAFGRLSAPRALVTGLRAALANWAAFLGLGLAVIGLAVAAALVLMVLLLFLSLALGTLGQYIGQVVLIVTAMFIQMLMVGTQYVAFRDVFGPIDSSPVAKDDQLLA
ncbi:MAG: hypothetical protein HND55_02245 [Pseudomonadota bacterium]|nr:MAG: hypothetical protein HND55_02245 [Pseudomonadota bacterium]